MSASIDEIRADLNADVMAQAKGVGGILTATWANRIRALCDELEHLRRVTPRGLNVPCSCDHEAFYDPRCRCCTWRKS